MADISRRQLLIRAAPVPLAVLAGCGLGGPAHRASAPGAAASVEMTNGLSFQPERVTIRAGETVEWRNTSLFTHTVTADPAKVEDRSHVELPPGAAPFDSGLVPAGEIYRHTFTEPGIYRYVCRPHESMGMRGTVEVTG